MAIEREQQRTKLAILSHGGGGNHEGESRREASGRATAAQKNTETAENGEHDRVPRVCKAEEECWRRGRKRKGKRSGRRGSSDCVWRQDRGASGKGEARDERRETSDERLVEEES